MTDCVVNIDLTVPSSSGPDVPASGYIEFRPSKRRDLEGAIVLPDKFKVRLDENGSATVTLAPTVDGDWAWRATERIQRGRQWYFNVPDGPGPVDYDDLEEVDKDTLNPTTPIVPVWKQYVDTADALARDASNLTSGTIPDARLSAAIARVTDVTTAVAGEASARDTAISNALNALLDGAPGALDTLNELAAAVNDDASFAASVTSALSDKQPLATMLTKLAALSSTLTDGQLIKWDATLGEPVAVNPVGAGRIAGAVNATGTATSLPPGGSGGAGAIQTIPSTAISVTNSNGRNVVIRFGASFNQTVAGTGGVFMYLRETTAGNTGDRKIMVTPLTGSATSGNTFTTNNDEFDIGVVTTTRTFELRAGLFTPTGQTPTATVYNSATSCTWIRADAA